VEIRTLTTPQELFAAAAELVVSATTDAVAQRGRFTIALSGGSTPKGLFNLLATNARTALPWDRMFFFWGDERHVPPTDPDSNYRMAEETMLSKVPVPAGNVFRMAAENPDAAAAAEDYEKTLRKFFGIELGQSEPGQSEPGQSESGQSGSGQFPRFDLILLGMGPDGHTASLFPGSAGLQEKSRLVIANWVEKFKTHRLSFTFPVLNAAACVAFLVSGTDKAPALHAVLESDAPGEQYPAKLVGPVNGKLIWLVDKAAASELTTKK
jgi:6-phosphogluconolactonase